MTIFYRSLPNQTNINGKFCVNTFKPSRESYEQYLIAKTLSPFRSMTERGHREFFYKVKSVIQLLRVAMNVEHRCLGSLPKPAVAAWCATTPTQISFFMEGLCGIE